MCRNLEWFGKTVLPACPEYPQSPSSCSVSKLRMLINRGGHYLISLRDRLEALSYTTGLNVDLVTSNTARQTRAVAGSFRQMAPSRIRGLGSPSSLTGFCRDSDSA